MAVIRKSQAEAKAVAGLEETMQLGATATVKGLAKYRHTILFATTAMLVIAIAAAVAATKVNSTIASLAEKQIIELAEEITIRNARHIQSMITGGQGMAWRNSILAMHSSPRHAFGRAGTTNVPAPTLPRSGADLPGCMSDCPTFLELRKWPGAPNTRCPLLPRPNGGYSRIARTPYPSAGPGR